jgi:hypothetical protein
MLVAVLILAMQGCSGPVVLPTATRAAAATATTAVAASAEAATPTATPQAQRPTETPTAAKPASLSATPSPVPPTATGTPLPAASAPPPVFISDFSAYPAHIEAGDSVTLTWEASGDWATIYKTDEQGRLIEPSYPVSLTGTLVLTTSMALRNQADFFLYAGAGNIYERSLVSVPIGCPDEWFFPDPPAGCPLAPHVTTAVAQHFEHGKLLWLQASGEERPFDEIYALYDDNVSPHWQTMVDDWEPDMPETDPEIVPPPGLFQPVRGFGKVWRERPGVRERLGWATDEEFQIENGVIQCAAGAYASCYVTGPEGVVYVLYANGADWAAWTGSVSEP